MNDLRRRLVGVLGLLAATGLTFGCEKKPDPAQTSSSATSSTVPKESGSSAPSASVPTPPTAQTAPKPVEATSKALAAHPEMLLAVPWRWRDRLAAHLRGETTGEACPNAEKPKNEFDKGTNPCAAENDKALGFLKACPQTATFEARLSKYDFANKRYVL